MCERARKGKKENQKRSELVSEKVNNLLEGVHLKADTNNQGLHKLPVKMAFAGLKKQINKANQVSDLRVLHSISRGMALEMTDPWTDRDSEG